MTELPTLLTTRLTLRPFRLMDAPEVRRMAGNVLVARHVGDSVPHPYPEGAAEAWISTHAETFAKGTEVALAMVRLSDQVLVGSIGLYVAPAQGTAELGYWVGEEFWAQGFASEAAHAVVAYGFETLNLHRIFARAHSDNPGSCRVLERIGMTLEGTQRGHSVRLGVRHDLCLYGLLATEWRATHSKPVLTNG